jgi:hypothetical protein
MDIDLKLNIDKQSFFLKCLFLTSELWIDMDIQILESNFTQDLGEIEKRVDKLNKDGK